MTKLTYRPEIDCLRAIAVGAVIIYHAKIYILGELLFPGGFLGVDIFFVISGYLISSIIIAQSFAFIAFIPIITGKLLLIFFNLLILII